MSGFRNALAGPQVAPGPVVNRLAPQSLGVMTGNALAPPPGAIVHTPPRQRTEKAFPADTRPLDPPPMTAAPVMAQQPPAPMLQAAPAMQAQADAPVPAGQPPAGPAGMTPQQALEAQILKAAQPADLVQFATTSDHALHAISTLLTRRGDITNSDIKQATDAALDGKKANQAQIDAVMGRLPPTSDQGALRAALVAEMQRSVQTAVTVHSEAQARGLDLPAMMQGADSGRS